jgi:hypothetical protein
MPLRRIPFDLDRVRELVAAGATMNHLAFEFCCSVGTIRSYLREHGLVAALADCGVKPDPTPEEIEERARECREKHFQARRREPWETTRIQLWREGRLQET